MVVELKGQQIRIRVHSPSRYSKFRLHDVGKKGRLQRVVGWCKKTGWETQSWRINLKDYSSEKDALHELHYVQTTAKHKQGAVYLIKKWFKKKKK